MLLSAPTTTPRSSPPADAWRVRVTDRDILEAHDAWRWARRSGAPAERVRELREDLQRLWRAR